MPPSTKTPSPSPSNRRIRATSLDPTTFAPFGQVLQNPETHNGEPELESAIANQGTATKWLDVSELKNWYRTIGAGKVRSGKEARSVVNMFVCRPIKLRGEEGVEGGVLAVRILERHPYTPQTFVPMGLGKEDRGTCYLVIVAPTLHDGSRPMHAPKGTGPPDLENVQAFIARGDQAVTYGPGTWHAPMVVLGEQPIEFVVVQYANGVADEDCQEHEIDDGLLSVDIGNLNDDGGEPKARL